MSLPKGKHRAILPVGAERNLNRRVRRSKAFGRAVRGFGGKGAEGMVTSPTRSSSMTAAGPTSSAMSFPSRFARARRQSKAAQMVAAEQRIPGRTEAISTRTRTENGTRSWRAATTGPRPTWLNRFPSWASDRRGGSRGVHHSRQGEELRRRMAPRGRRVGLVPMISAMTTATGRISTAISAVLISSVRRSSGIRACRYGP